MSDVKTIRATIPQADVRGLRKNLMDLEKATRNKYIREATRAAHKTHILPQVRRATPDGSGKRSRGRSLNVSGLSKRGGTNLSAGSYMMRKSTGRLRRDFRVAAMKRSRRITGTSVVNYKKTIWYGKFLEQGRTHNLFLPMREWKKIPDSRKGKSGDLWKKGRHMWLRVAQQRSGIARNSAIRKLWYKIEKHTSRQR